MDNLDFLKNFDFWAVIVAAASLLWTAITSRKLNKQQKELNEQQSIINKYLIKSNKEDEVNKKKASLSIKTFDNSKSDTIRVSNSGPSTAYNIVIDWQEIKNEDSGIYINEDGKLPFMNLNKDEYFDMFAFLAEGRIKTPKIIIRWEDEYSKNNTKEVTLTFG